MASLFGHAFTALVAGQALSRKNQSSKLILLGIFCSVFPDADVISFVLGIPYDSFWGHRGFSHSIFFALLLATLVTFIFYNRIFFSGKAWLYILFLSLCTCLHGLLDAMTNGGLGIAFFAPFDNSRYFLPFRPIIVSPIGAGNFFSSRGIEVIMSEAIWIGIPGLLFMLALKLIRFLVNKNSGREDIHKGRDAQHTL